MSRRVIEISSGNKHLGTYRGFLKISENGQEKGRVALDDICSVIVAGHGNTYSNDLVVALAERNIWMVICGQNYLPAAWLQPTHSNFAEAQRIDYQLSLSAPQKKRLWQQVIRTKILGQAELLDKSGQESERLKRLASEVRSGDSTNREALAAQYYWPTLFGTSFRRDRQLPGINGALNYGYTVLRACVSRAISGVGLHPNIPLHHKNKYSAFRLADDLMEVFRPTVDIEVRRMAWAESSMSSLLPADKAALAGLATKRVLIEDKSVELIDAAIITAQSLLYCCRDKSLTLTLPTSLLTADDFVD